MSDSLTSTATAHLAALGRTATAGDEDGALAFTVDGAHGSYPARLRIDDAKRVLVLRVTSPVRADKPLRRTSVAELILRTGFGLPIGGVDVDYDSGAIRYRAGVDLADDGELTEQRLARLLSGAVTVLDWLHPALVAVAEEAELPEYAVEKVAREGGRG